MIEKSQVWAEADLIRYTSAFRDLLNNPDIRRLISLLDIEGLHDNVSLYISLYCNRVGILLIHLIVLLAEYRRSTSIEMRPVTKIFSTPGLQLSRKERGAFLWEILSAKYLMVSANPRIHRH